MNKTSKVAPKKSYQNSITHYIQLNHEQEIYEPNVFIKLIEQPSFIKMTIALALCLIVLISFIIISRLGYLNRIGCVINVPAAYNISIDQQKCANPFARSVQTDAKTSSNLLRVINGYTANQNWPFIVSIRYLVNMAKISDHMCGGALIYSQYVITAAHCLVRYKWNELVVIVGITNSNNPLDFSNTYYVNSITYHSKYVKSFSADGYDIGIIKLCKPVTLSDKVSTVCLPTSNINLINKTITVIGWGSTNALKSDISNELKQADLTIVNGDIECVPYANKSIHSILYCARDDSNLNNPSKMSNICYGDSGGPMLYKIGNIWYLYGITSFTLANKNQSCNPIRPSFFTSVPNFIDWINENVKNHGSNRNFCFFNYIFLPIMIRMYK